MAEEGYWDKLSQLWPARAAKGLWEGLMLPGDVAQGNVSMWGDDGHTNPQVINRSADLAGAVMGGGMPMAERGALGMAGGRLSAPQIKVMKAGKDTYNIVDHEGKVLANADIGIVNIGGKRLAQIDDINTPALNNVTTQAEHDAAVASGRNALGTGHMREAMRQFLEMHPDVEGFTGNRVSGARNAGAMGAENIQNITVPIPMSYENLWKNQ